MDYRKYFLFILLFIKHISPLWAIVDQKDSLFYQIGFEQELNEYKWLSEISYQRPIFGMGRIHIGENFNSSLIRLSKDDRKWKDDQRLNLNLYLPYSKIWGLNFAASANQFSDRLSGIVRDIKTNWATLGFQIQSRPKIKLVSDIGYKYDDRLARNDRGTTHSIHILADSVITKDYENKFYFLSKGDKYAVRQNNDFELQYQVKRYFQENTFDSLSIFWTKKRRDNYSQLVAENIFTESYEEENQGVLHNLLYGSQEGIRFRFRNMLLSRKTSISKLTEYRKTESRSKSSFHSENEIEVIYQHTHALLISGLNYETDNQRNDVPIKLNTNPFSRDFAYISPDFKSSRLTLSTEAHFYFFGSDTLQLSGSISRYRYDTPENNVDDRDELRWNINIMEIHHFSRYLKLITNGSVNLNHLVYIFGEQSANNNWMRIFALFPQIIYRPNNKFSLIHRLEVLANYVDYDFETGTSSSDLKSYIYRRFSFMQEINIQITSHIRVFSSSRVELEENGKLDWEQWTEFLQMNRETYWLRTNLAYQVADRFIIAPGFLYSRRIEKNQSYSPFPGRSGEKKGIIVSYGPTLKLMFSPHKKINLSFEGIRRVVTTHSVWSSFFNNFYLTLTWYK